MGATTLGLGCYAQGQPAADISKCCGLAWGHMSPNCSATPHAAKQHAVQPSPASAAASTGACSSSDLVRKEAACQRSALLSADLAVSAACSGCWAPHVKSSQSSVGGMWADAAAWCAAR